MKAYLLYMSNQEGKIILILDPLFKKEFASIVIIMFPIEFILVDVL